MAQKNYVININPRRKQQGENQQTIQLQQTQAKAFKASNNFKNTILYVYVFIAMTSILLWLSNRLIDTVHLSVAEIGIQASIIAFILTIVVLVISTYFLFRSRELCQEVAKISN